MSSRYLTVVGILGEPNAGKTACLVSLYLLVANAGLEGWTFADSRSLMAFEELARGARRWNQGRPPEQMTAHTELSDDRSPGFLHLRLRRRSDGQLADLALPDLPGEWTKTLLRQARSDRFEFLRSADVIWIFIDGRTLADRERRQGAVARVGQLGARLRTMMGDAVPRLVVVVTHRDRQDPTPEVLDRIGSELAKHRLVAAVVPVASFSDSEAIRPGHGIVSLIDATVARGGPRPEPWPVTEPWENDRSFLSHRRAR